MGSITIYEQRREEAAIAATRDKRLAPYRELTAAIDSAADHIADAIDRNTAQMEELKIAVLVSAMPETEREYERIDSETGKTETRYHSTNLLFRGWPRAGHVAYRTPEATEKGADHD